MLKKFMTYYMKRIVLLALVLQSSMLLMAKQNNSDTALFTYGNKQVTTQEFYKGFMKNKHKDSSIKAAELDEYLELYKKFKLKVQDAYDQELDKTEEFKAELGTYRKQIAKPYLTDKVVNEQLVNEAYERLKYEVKASHILVFARPDAAPADTLKAYNKLLGIKKEIESGSISFDNAAVKYSDDPSAADNQGNLGYFTAFQMIYEFENYAYNTPVGKVSQVFRTEFGYHIVKVNDKRLSQGDVTIRQIRIDLNPNPSQEEVLEAEAKINEVYKKLQAGEKFVNLVQQYSEDAQSVLKNGELPPFAMTSVRYPENFKNTAFSLKADGDYAQPIQTATGFHIIQRIALKPIEDLSKMRSTILTKIGRDSRQYRNTLAVFERAKKYYAFKENKKYGKVINKAIDTSLLYGEFHPSQEQLNAKPFAAVLFNLSKVNKAYTVKDFANWVVEIQKPSSSKALASLLDQYYQAYRLQTVMDYYENDLENINDTFAALYKEYKEGILLFSLTDKKVWSKSVEDTSGLRQFFSQQAQKYMFKERYEATIYRCADKTIAETVKKDLLKGITSDSSMRKLNKANPLNVSNPMTGKYEQGNNQYANMIFTSSVHVPSRQTLNQNNKYLLFEDPKSAGAYVLIVVHQYLPAGLKSLNDARGSVMSDYQTFLEREWVNTLMNKYPIQVDQQVFSALKARMVRP
jgi:peptidyl-prolyl cis-trans isomerase SurA